MERKIVFVGCCEFGVEIFNSLIDAGYKITQLVCLLPEFAERNGVSGYFDYRNLAAKNNIPVYHPKTYSLKSDEDVAFFSDNKFDLMILGGWQRLIPSEILESLSIGGLGVHGSSEFLPKGRGRSPVNWSLIEGKKRFILHLFLLKPAADDGDVINYQIFDINEFDDCKTLYYKIGICTKRLILDNIEDLFEGKVKLITQEGEPTYYPKRTPEDGKINFTSSVFEIYDFIRALTKPYPGAFCSLNGKRVNIWKAQLFDTRITYPGAKEGQIVEVFNDGNFVVNCNSGLLLITESDAAPKKGDLLE